MFTSLVVWLLHQWMATVPTALKWEVAYTRSATVQRRTTICRSPIPQKHSYGNVRKVENPHRQRENFHTHQGIQTGFGNHRTANHKAQSVRVKEEKGARKERAERGWVRASWMEIRVCYPEDIHYIWTEGSVGPQVSTQQRSEQYL